MMKWADLIDQHVEEIAALDAIDAGKLYHLLKAIEVPATANTIHYYAGAADKIHGEVLKPAREFHAYILYLNQLVLWDISFLGISLASCLSARLALPWLLVAQWSSSLLNKHLSQLCFMLI